MRFNVNGQLTLMSVPAVAFTVIMIAFPFFYTIWLSLQQFGYGGASFSGFANYIQMVEDGAFWNSLRVTIFLYLLCLALQLVIGTYIAVLLSSSKHVSGIIRSLIISPFVMPPVVIGMMWLVILDPSIGAANYFLSQIGLPQSNWLASPTMVLPTFALLDTWQWAPYIALIVFGGLQALPRSVYESAQIDGASRFTVFRRITLPLLLPTIATAAILRSVDLLRFFDLIYITTQGGPNNASDTINIYGFRIAFRFFEFGYASTMMLTLSAIVLGVILVLLQIRKSVVW
jgi:multiple sugar transport system permease protein